MAGSTPPSAKRWLLLASEKDRTNRTETRVRNGDRRVKRKGGVPPPRMPGSRTEDGVGGGIGLPLCFGRSSGLVISRHFHPASWRSGATGDYGAKGGAEAWERGGRVRNPSKHPSVRYRQDLTKYPSSRTSLSLSVSASGRPPTTNDAGENHNDDDDDKDNETLSTDNNPRPCPKARKVPQLPTTTHKELLGAIRPSVSAFAEQQLLGDYAK
ncbi:hypothetical protein B0T20DRAFT_391351 [Sordaria brevicollis]|uniref:Uncharacterized protein n=1 Tax=Sordaria brevicollis TaxID=83679 RepID=A0AAE0UD73_SORBR|nr:hypothetical protein B0T20DRAFT_391351 [Sordaria brevicollis]